MSSTKKPPPTSHANDEDDEDFAEEEYLDDDDDDDDEDDFVPGVEEEEDDDEDESDNANIAILDGTLSLDADHKLLYQGDGFQLTSVEALTNDHAQLLLAGTPSQQQDGDAKQSSKIFSLPSTSIILHGTCDLPVDSKTAAAKKPTFRKIQVTWTQQKPTGNGDKQLPLKTAALKSTGEDDEDDGKKPSSTNNSSVYYQVYGRQEDDPNHHPSELLEFRGEYHPQGGSNGVNLVCQARYVPSSTTTTATTSAMAKSAPMAVAAARSSNGSDDDDDDYDDPDEGVEMDELIALHEDAGLSVDAIMRKRYNENENDASAKPAAKKGKTSADEDDDDDDEYGF